MTTAPRAGAPVLLCRCTQARVVPADVVDAVSAHAAASGIACLAVDDLCGLAAEDPALLRRALEDGPVVAACHPRAVRALLRAAGCASAGDAACVNLRAAEGPGAAVRALCAHTLRPGALTALPARTSAWTPWFPAIDPARCRQCGQCLDFCLFGVYARDAAGGVCVAAPTSCKMNCPACARICPEAAIVFPKLDEEPLNGAEIRDEAAQRARIRVDVDRVLGSDVYRGLRERRARARALFADRARAEAEREACRSGRPADAEGAAAS